MTTQAERWYVILAWRGDGRYHVQDAIGARVYKRRATADQTVEEFNQDPGMLGANPDGYVLRSLAYVQTHGCEIRPNGTVRMADCEVAA